METKIAIKRRKRKLKLAKRVKCHGNKMSEIVMHPTRPKLPEYITKSQKLSWWQKLLKWLHII